MTLPLRTMDEIDLEALSSIYSEASRDTFLSVYLNLDDRDARRFFDSRVEIIRKSIRKDRELSSNFERCVKEAGERFKSPVDTKAKTYVLFISSDPEYTEEFTIPLRIDDLVILDTSPYIRPLALLSDEYLDYALVVVDSEHFKVYNIASTKVTGTSTRHTDLIGKHKKGGWSQMRFSRLRKEGIQRFQRSCIEDLMKLLEDTKPDGIILAGPTLSRDQFIKELPGELKEQIMARLDINVDLHESKLLDLAREHMLSSEKEEAAHFARLLKEAIFSGENVTYGLDETLKMTEEGRASLLLVDPDYKVPGFICEKDQFVGKGKKVPCPVCGGRTSDVDVVEEIIEFAYRMGTRVEFVRDNDDLKELGSIAAFLRY